MSVKLVDGRAIAQDIESSLRSSFLDLNEKGVEARLEVLSFGDDKATQSFLKIKRSVANRIGVHLSLHELPRETLESVAREILISLTESGAAGVVVQLPLPAHIEKSSFLSLIPEMLDVDCLTPGSLDALSRGESGFISPVALSVKEVLDRSDINPVGKKIAVVGYGDLVGKPVSFFLKNNGADVEIFDSNSDLGGLRSFDIIISGVGKPGLIQAEHVREGAVLIDAGTSESEGRLSGDMSNEAREKASLATPVPGGIGPITVVKLFENVLSALKKLHHVEP